MQIGRLQGPVILAVFLRPEVCDYLNAVGEIFSVGRKRNLGRALPIGGFEDPNISVRRRDQSDLTGSRSDEGHCEPFAIGAPVIHISEINDAFGRQYARLTAVDIDHPDFVSLFSVRIQIPPTVCHLFAVMRDRGADRIFRRNLKLPLSVNLRSCPVTKS